MEKAELRELNVNELTGGSKLMNILRKSLPEAKDSFFYKMLRKKNITLNNKKATGSEIVSTGDVIKFFLSDETYDKFAGKASKAVVFNGKANGNRADDSGAGADKLNHGSVVCVLLYRHFGAVASMVGASAVVVLIRYLAAHYRWNLPKLTREEEN